MAKIPFVPPLDDVHYGRVDQVSPQIRRVIAENPGKFSYRGTGTYIVGHGDVVVIDPGPVLDSHRDALAAAISGETVRAILVTHCHSDHSPLAAWLREETGAPTIAFGPHGEVDPDPEPDDEPDDAPAESGEGSPEADGAADPVPKESADVDFVPDIAVVDGDVVAEIGGMTLRAVFTPGHTSNHMCFSFDAERALFTGDHVMGWSTTVVSPPDGDIRDYIESLHKVIGRDDTVLWPTHGNPVLDVQPFLAAYLAHRMEREEQVLNAVRSGLRRIPDMVEVLYADVAKELHKAAGRSVLAHLGKLIADGKVTFTNPSAPASAEPSAPATELSRPRIRATFEAV